MSTNDRDWLMRDDHLPEAARRPPNGQGRGEEDGERVNLLNPQGEYEAHDRPANKYLTRLHIMKVGQDAVTFQFVHLRSNSRGGNGGFVLEFDDGERWRVTVRGRNLWEVYDYCTLHRMPALRELGADRDYPERFPRDKAVITSIEIERVDQEG